MTIEVQTPQGLKRGESVIGHKCTSNPAWARLLGWPSESCHIVGEAPFVDLGEGRYVFASLAESGMGIKQIEPRLPTSSAGSWFREELYQKDGTPGHYGWPMIVTFTDMNDGSSVAEVDRNSLSAAFGAGYSLKSVKIVQTDDPVTWGQTDRFTAILNADLGRFILRQGKPN